MSRLFPAVVAALLLSACGNADSVGVGRSCDADTPCPKVGSGEDEVQLICLDAFKGGYCGLSGCTADTDCPTGSICIVEGVTNYCFRTCTDKPECNGARGADEESNCSANVTHYGTSTEKACVPPSAG